MPPIDPQKLLQALGPLLSDNGGIKGAKEATRLALLMKDASKLVSRCVYLNILRVTSSSDAIEKFIEVGGWDILNTWLDLSRTDNNEPLLGEILEVYQNLPVTVSLLKKNGAAKTIKHLTKTDNEKIKNLSSNLVDLWTKTIRTNNKEDDDSKLKKKDKERGDRDRNKENDRKEKKDTEKHRNGDKDRHRDKDRKDRDRHKTTGKEREKESRPKDSEKESRYKDNKSKSSSDIKSLAKSSSSHPSFHTSSKSKDNSVKKITPPDEAKASSAPSDSKVDEENRLRPKTVKRVKNNFRSTGLFDEEEEEDPEQSVKKSDKLSSKRVGLDLPGDETSEKKPRLQLTMPILTPANLEPVATTPPEVQHGRIKIIPPKRGPNSHEIQDSNVFMNALQKTSYSTGIKKKKKLPSVSTPPSTTLSTPSLLHSVSPSIATSPPSTSTNVEKGPTSPPLLSPTTAQIQKLPSVPSFYRDTLDDVPEPTDTKETKESEESGAVESMDTMPPLLPPSQTDQQEANNTPSLTEGNSGDPKEEQSGTTDMTMEVDPESKPKSNKPRKNVTWARESYLEEYFYFELDETERENVNRPKSFSEMKREEMMLDKRAMESARRTSNDVMEPVLPWRRPKLIEDIIIVVEPGKESTQREVQAERERAVLCALYFNKVPDTPTEPDPEIPLEDEEMKAIPLEDETGACTEYEHTYKFEDPSSLPYDPEFGLPVAGGPPPPMNPGQMNNNGRMDNSFNLPPALSRLLNTLRQQAQETRDPVMQNLQGHLTHVLQNTPPQDNGMLMDRILQALEPFKNQIPGLSNLIGSLMSNGMDQNLGNNMGPRGMPPGGPNQMSNPPRHGLLGTGPPGFNMMGPGNMRPSMQGGPNMNGPGPGPGPNMQAAGWMMHGEESERNGDPFGGPPPPMMGNGGGNSFYSRGGPGGGPRHGMGDMRMGGPPWKRGGGRGKRGGHKKDVVCQHFIKKGNCRFGHDCSFLHPGADGYS